MSRVIQYIDTEEELLSKELGVNVRIRDRRYIATHITTSHVRTEHSINTAPVPHVVEHGGEHIPLIAPWDNVRSPAV